MIWTVANRICEELELNWLLVLILVNGRGIVIIIVLQVSVIGV